MLIEPFQNCMAFLVAHVQIFSKILGDRIVWRDQKGDNDKRGID